MIKTLLTTIVMLFIFSACSSTEQMQTDNEIESDTSTNDEVAPWYDHANRAYSDSTEFAGLGIAIAADSSEAMENSMNQARENLEFAIDSYAESVRRQLVEDAGNTDLSSGTFIYSLRQAVNNLQFSESDLSSMVEYTLNENNAVIAYSRISIPRDIAINSLASAIENSAFSNSLQEASAR
jgi:hypothetical protein